LNVEVLPARRREDVGAFVAFPYELHAADPLFTPPLRRDVRELISARKNPFFEHGEVQLFLARAGGRVLGRVCAVDNRLHREVHQEEVGFFGLFECIDDRGVAASLLEVAGGWLRSRGLRAVRGPASFSTNEECGLLVQGFDTPATLMMAHNPPYYPALVEHAGFRKVKDLLAFQSPVLPLPERLARGSEQLQQRYDIHLRTVDLGRFEQEVAAIKRLYNAGWERNWGFVPLTDLEIEHVARQLKQIVVPELVVFAEREGQPIGFAVALPDMNEALRANRSGRLFPGVLKILWAARGIRRLRVMMLGALPDWRGRGIDVLLYRHIWETAIRKGYTWGEAGWILEDNHAMRNGLVRMGFEAYKTYRMYERAL
jgi:GNAT superfamily N-acetyltransferase